MPGGGAEGLIVVWTILGAVTGGEGGIAGDCGMEGIDNVADGSGAGGAVIGAKAGVVETGRGGGTTGVGAGGAVAAGFVEAGGGPGTGIFVLKRTSKSIGGLAAPWGGGVSGLGANPAA